uniref:Mitochondrial 37S ribosomal protein S19 n=1 Tax=Pyricularia oryzae (strain P131) TaxID=1143193 RepID=L7JMU4_PYRO1
MATADEPWCTLDTSPGWQVCCINEAQASRPTNPVPPRSRRQYAADQVSTQAIGVEGLPIPKLTLGVNPRPIRTQARAATILPNFVGLKFQVYNGKVYHEVQITEEMVGHKLGEFSP